jgi:RNase P/RNase MRP subunit POP5
MQRGKVKWVKEGDVGTRFFHAHATIRHRKNLIATLKDSMGNFKSTHEEKVDILWNSFKDRLGVTEFSKMQFNLTELLHPSNGWVRISRRGIHQRRDR